MEKSGNNAFAPWELSLAVVLVREFQQHHPWLKQDFDDLLQECLIQWHAARPTFNAKKSASLKTYMTRVIKNKLNDILRTELAEKRKFDLFSTSLEGFVEEEGTPLEEVIPDESTTFEDKVALHIELEKVAAELAPFQIKLCQLLSQGYSLRDIARILGRSKSTVEEEIKKVREIFSDKGLKEYLH